MSEPVNWLGGCAEVLALYGLKAQCCGSCHSDEEYGYSSLTDYNANGGVYEICCGTRAAINSKKSRCVNGHEFTQDNTYLGRAGERACRACILNRVRAHREKLKRGA